MPAIIEMRLKATWTVRPDTGQLHGLACALFESSDTEHEGQHKPRAVWPLRPGASPQEWAWRAAWLPDTIPPAGALSVDVLRVGHVSCTVTESRHRRASHAALAGGPPLTQALVTFASPVYFAQNGTDTAAPDPRLIAGSWRRRWNASLPDSDPLAVSDAEGTLLSRLLSLGAFDLRTERRDNGHGRDRKAFGALARFAGYCGTGAQTTHGFGATTVTSADA